MSEDYIRKRADSGLRLDERKLEEFRQISVETDVIKNAEGSARVKIGKTHVLAGVKMSVGEPFSDTPNEGVLIVNAEFSPVASPEFEAGPPSERSIEVARVTDRGVRESKCIDVEKLCITPGEAVWMVNVDLHILDYDGNLQDAAALAAIAALKATNLPKYENKKIVIEEKTGSLPVKDTPIAITTVKIGNTLLLDTNAEEEQCIDARITITTMENGNICSIQKGGTGYFTIDEIAKAADLSIAKGKELRKMIK
ncbi:MAG: exosome complex protein Rrp42 [Candidatus Aenigmarchaeota archaeon]|nr:exosome complex protein Rrp42 [Candidatus Aenigmarchaeota archaeon]